MTLDNVNAYVCVRFIMSRAQNLSVSLRDRWKTGDT